MVTIKDTNIYFQSLPPGHPQCDDQGRYAENFQQTGAQHFLTTSYVLIPD